MMAGASSRDYQRVWPTARGTTLSLGPWIRNQHVQALQIATKVSSYQGSSLQTNNASMWRETLLSDLRAAMSSGPRQQYIMWRSFQTTLVRVKRTSRREKWEQIRQAYFRYPTVTKLRLQTPIFNASTKQESIRASIIGHRAAIKCELNQWMNFSSVTAYSLEITRCQSKRATTVKSWSVTATLMWTVLLTKINHFREHISLSNLRGQPLRAMQLISVIRSRQLRSQDS